MIANIGVIVILRILGRVVEGRWTTRHLTQEAGRFGRLLLLPHHVAKDDSRLHLRRFSHLDVVVIHRIVLPLLF